MVEPHGIEPCLSAFQTDAITRLAQVPLLVGEVGIEPNLLEPYKSSMCTQLNFSPVTWRPRGDSNPPSKA